MSHGLPFPSIMMMSGVRTSPFIREISSRVSLPSSTHPLRVIRMACSIFIRSNGMWILFPQVLFYFEQYVRIWLAVALCVPVSFAVFAAVTIHRGPPRIPNLSGFIFTSCKALEIPTCRIGRL